MSIHRLPVVVVAGILAAGHAVADITVPGTNKTEFAAGVRKHLSGGKESGHSFPVRFTAASMAEKASPDGRISQKMQDRPGMIIGIYKQLNTAVMGTELPDAYKALVMKEYGRRFMFPIRQSPPRMGVRTVSAMVKGLPAESKMITIEPGKRLADYVQAVYPEFTKLSPLRQMLVYEGLDWINPLMMDLGSFLTDTGKGEGAPGIRRAEVGPELEPLQMYWVLHDIDPSLRLMPKETLDAHADKPQGEHLAVPVGAGKTRVRRYRVPVGAEMLIPTAEYMKELANPKKLDLKNSWLRDLSLLDGLTPEELDLAGNDASNIGTLSRMKALKKLSLYAMPVSDIAPLKSLPLTHLNLAQTRVSDLSPLKGMKLERLDLRDTKVTDISPLTGMPIAYLNLNHTAVSNLAPVAGMPLTYLQLNYATVYKSFMMLGDIATLKNIGDAPMQAWFKEYETYQNPETRPTDKDAPASSCGAPPAKKAPPKKKPVVVPKPKPKPKPPDPNKPPTITDAIDLDLEL